MAIDEQAHWNTARTRAWARPLLALTTTALYASSHNTASSPHVRDAENIQRLFFYVVAATFPALLIGLWNQGTQIGEALAQSNLTGLPGWRGALLAGLGWSPSVDSVGSNLLVGLVYFLPLFLVAFSAALLWELLFAVALRRTPETGALMNSWLYTLMLPTGMPLLFAALGMSFGVVFGRHVFGGGGRYIASPALLGVLFLYFSYPAQMGDGTGLPIPSATPTLLTLFADGGAQRLAQADIAWLEVFIGHQPSALGTSSALACAAGALFLVLVRVASLRILAGALLGLIGGNWLAAAAGADLLAPWYWHVCFGGFAYGLAFIATDPVAASVTRAGRWLFGLLIGLLVVLIRTADPAHPDGTLFAILLASLFASLIDQGVVRLHVYRRQRRRQRALRA